MPNMWDPGQLETSLNSYFIEFEEHEHYLRVMIRVWIYRTSYMCWLNANILLKYLCRILVGSGCLDIRT